ncbi:Ask10p PWA37_000386 [Arxiozyma heterogenica]|uniref:Ask10p n=1 Tax=Arxiozyma heterogenica TaxID=278026 RepID=UPI002F047BE0
MSDYFSVKPIPNNPLDLNTPDSESATVSNNLTAIPNTTTTTTTPSTIPSTTLAIPKYQDDTDAKSIQSSQYLMEMLPDNLTMTREPSVITSNTTIPNISISHANTYSYSSKDLILPKTDFRSPYYISVPIPNPNAKPQKSLSNMDNNDNNDNEEYFVREYPTDILIDRFHKWKKILKGLIGYLREIAYSQEQFARINTQLKSSVKFHFLTDIEEGSNRLIDPLTTIKPVRKQQPKTIAQQKKMTDSSKQQQQQENETFDNTYNNNANNITNNMDTYHNNNNNNNNNTNEYPFEYDILATSGFMKFGSGSIQDIQVVLKKHHLALANHQLKISKEISTVIIPKLESLRKDLGFKIKEIKELHSDFKTNMNHHLDLTHKLLHKYIASVKYMNSITKKKQQTQQTQQTDLTALQPKHDPYLLKLQLDLQLKRQIAEENYLQEAYINLQSSGMKLEKIIYSKIQNALQRYSALIDSEARLTIKNLCHELQQGMLSKPPAIEWDHFVNHHPTCLINWKSNDPLPTPRKFSDIIYPNMKTSFAKCIRAGYFYKKSNFSKEYRKGYFVLTPNYLHEFKSSNFYKNNNTTAAHANTGAATAAVANQSSGNITGSSSNHKSSSTHSSSTSLAQQDIATNNTLSYTGQQTQQQNQQPSLTPIMSIPLNDCSLVKVSDHHFTLKGKAIFIDSINKTKNPSLANAYNNSFVSLSTSMSSNSLSNSSSSLGATTPNKSSMLSKKSRFSKLLNPGKSRQLKQEKQQRLSELQQETSIKEQESKNIVTWVFKTCNDEPEDSNEKHFKKWVQDLKHLCSYNTTNERMQYIEEKLWKSHLHRSSKLMHMTSGMSSPNINEYNGSTGNFETSYSTVQLMENAMKNSNANNNNNNSLTKPQYISINNTPMLNAESSFRSKINTPAIDDNGNLVTMAERKSYSFSPNHSSTSDLSTTANNDQPYLSTQQQWQAHPNLPTVITPTGSSTSTRYGHHQRNVSLPVSLGQMNIVNSPASVTSEVSGYFAIPVNRSSNEQLPNAMTPPLSRTTSRGASSVNINRLPKVRLNNQDMKDNSNRPTIKENASTGSLPSLNKQNTNELYQRTNSSATNLQTLQTSRVHPIRKHKKNVSFTSLNSLMFAKKSGSNHAFTGNQFIGGGIREDDDDNDSDKPNQPALNDKIKLNQSIYS